MANKKFSEFVLKTTTSDVSHIVGYNGAENVQITPANFVTGGGTGVFLPLAGGTMVGNTIHNDNVRSVYGTSSDGLQIFHNGTDSLILDSGTGNLRILGSTNVRIQNQADNSDMIVGNSGTSVDLYYNNSKKFETTSTGISVEGNGVFTDNIGIGAAPVGNPATRFLAVGEAGVTAGGIQLWAGASQTHFIQFGDAASGDDYFRGAISYAHSTNTLSLLQNAVNALSFSGSQLATFSGVVIVAEATNKGQLFFGSADTNYEIKGGGNFGYLSLNAPILRFDTGGSEKMRLDASGNLGIGTSTPQLPLHIEGATGSQVVISAASDSVGTTAGILLRAEAGESNSLARVKGAIFFERIAGTYGNGDLKFAVNSDANNDTVTVADTKMTINSAGLVNITNSADYSLRFSNQSAYNSGINNGIVFNGKYTSGGSNTDMASIRGGKDNTVDTHFGGKLTFHTRQNGGVDTKRMEIDSIGNAAIGMAVSSTNRLSVGGIIKSAGNNNYQNILTKEGSTGTFTFNFTELGNGLSDNVSYFIMVTVYRPTTDVANDVATLLLHGIMPRGGTSVFNTINTLKGAGIAVLTATNNGNSLVITTDSNVNLRCALTLTTVGGTT